MQSSELLLSVFAYTTKAQVSWLRQKSKTFSELSWSILSQLKGAVLLLQAKENWKRHQLQEGSEGRVFIKSIFHISEAEPAAHYKHNYGHTNRSDEALWVGPLQERKVKLHICEV